MTSGSIEGRWSLMIENHRTGLLRDIMRRCGPVLTGPRPGARLYWVLALYLGSHARPAQESAR